ncbi:MAG: threonine aldolase family protein [Bacteroidota bacterium]
MSSNGKKTFASDNYAGVHPEIMAALALANEGHEGSYGADRHTAACVEKFRSLFGADTEVFLMYNGTGANVVALSAMANSWQAVICPESAHINVDESTAPEKFTGCKLIAVPTPDGKLTPELIKSRIQRVGDQHHPQAKVVSISQPTEYGTLYTADEVSAIAEVAHANNLLLHMDGARISNAAVALGMDFRTFTRDAGVDVLSFGGTKNGMMFGEAILVFRKELSSNLQYLRKQGMQLHSKMRFIAAQFNAMLSNDCWARNARHANTMAARLAAGIATIPSVKLTQRVQVNGLFIILPPALIPVLQEQSFFYVWNESISEVRLMCSWDTTEADVDGFLDGLRKSLANA